MPTTNKQQMNARKVFKEFLVYLHETFPESFPTVSFDEAVEIPEFEKLFLVDFFKILKHDITLFEEPRVIFNVDISELVVTHRIEQPKIWQHLQSCLMAAFLTGDMKEKIKKILESFKDVWAEAGHSTDEIDKILEDKESRDKISELLEYVTNSRLSTVVINIIEQVDLSDLDLEFETPEEAMNMFKNIQSNPKFEKIMKNMRDILQEKMRNGQISQDIIVREVETIKLKVTDAFGDMFNGVLGGRQAEVPAEVLISNSPDARRARMLARLQRKVKERRDGKNSS